VNVEAAGSSETWHLSTKLDGATSLGFNLDTPCYGSFKSHFVKMHLLLESNTTFQRAKSVFSFLYNKDKKQTI
jgi:hypothetical protein